MEGMLVKWDQAQRNVSVNAVEMETDASWFFVPWRLTKGAEPCAVKAASTVLNGGDGETGRKVLRPVPTQPGSRARLKRGVSAPSTAWRFLQGERPCRTRPNQPIVPSVAVMKEEAKIG